MNKASFVVDLDMVLADFRAGAAAAARLHLPADDASWIFWERWGWSTAKMWQTIHAYGDRFYGEMVPMMKGAATLVDAVGDNFVIMSAPGYKEHVRPVDWAGKWLWISKYFPAIPPHKLIVGLAKEKLAQPHVMLIDDSQDGCDKFAAAGGAVCVYPQKWNSNAHLTDKRLEYATECIERHKSNFPAECATDATKRGV